MNVKKNRQKWVPVDSRYQVSKPKKTVLRIILVREMTPLPGFSGITREKKDFSTKF